MDEIIEVIAEAVCAENREYIEVMDEYGESNG